jgi:pimeloyl-ACP methyl ester carboxylesterase
MNRALRVLTLLLLAFPIAASDQEPAAGKNEVEIRDRKQAVYFYPSSISSPKPQSILFAPGDGGWRGFAVTLAQVMASWGYNVYGLDTRQYLSSFTGKTTLKEEDVMHDFHDLAQWITKGSEEPVVLVGWSEGAGLCLLAAADQNNKRLFRGLVSLGMTETNVLGWHFWDAISYLTKEDPKEPKFNSRDYLPRVAPLPLWMIQASQDQFVSVSVARTLFDLARDPKRFTVIEAKNHRFEGNEEALFRTLREALQWITQGLN